MAACLKFAQVTAMRFSAIFQLPLASAAGAPRDAASARGEPAQAAAPVTAEAAPAALPDDLDARVRLVGEWQMSEFD